MSYNELLTLLATGTGETKISIHLEWVGVDTINFIEIYSLIEAGFFSITLAVLLREALDGATDTSETRMTHTTSIIGLHL